MGIRRVLHERVRAFSIARHDGITQERIYRTAQFRAPMGFSVSVVSLSAVRPVMTRTGKLRPADLLSGS
jgi:hypothetical protein